LALVHSDLAAAKADLTRAVAAFRKSGEQSLLAPAVHNLAVTHQFLGEFDKSATLFTESLSLAQDDWVNMAFSLEALAEIDLAQGRLADGVARLREAIDAARAAKSEILLANHLATAGHALLTIDELDEAEKYIDELATLGSQSQAPGRHMVLPGLLLGRRGRITEGLELMRKGIVNFQTIPGYQRLSAPLADLFDQWAGLELATGNPGRAVSVQAASDRIRAGSHRLAHQERTYARQIGAMKEAQSPEEFERAWRRGEAFTIDELIDFVTDPSIQ
jgi:tetratricopeptide (TPR) repeat protein